MSTQGLQSLKCLTLCKYFKALVRKAAHKSLFFPENVKVQKVFCER